MTKKSAPAKKAAPAKKSATVKGALPTIYKQARDGTVVYWRTSTEGDKIHVEYGKVGTDNPTKSVKTIRKGKNIGKKNEQTPAEVARENAQSVWKLKLHKEGYTQELAKAERGERDSIAPLPMLAYNYSDCPSEMPFPCIGQPKLDGMRLLGARELVGATTLWTRDCNIKTNMPHINQAISDLTRLGAGTLDGEFYNHIFHANFSAIQSLLKKEKADAGSPQGQMHVYDIFSRAPYTERLQMLHELIPDSHPVLKRVPFRWINSPDEVMKVHDEYVALGYEGLILRNPHSPYVHDRTEALLKVKQWVDNEFKIVDVVEGEGKLEGHGLFICETKEGLTFEVKMNGPQDALKEYWEHPERFIGKLLTVKHFGWTPNRKPRHAQGLRFRDYE